MRPHKHTLNLCRRLVALEMQDYIKGAYLVQTHCTDWAKNQTSLGCFETLAKASSPAQVQRDKNLWLCLCGAFSLELSTPTLGVSPGKGRSVPAAPWDKHISSDLLWIFCFYKYVQINYRHFEMSLVGINQHCKVMDSQSVKTQAGFSRQWFWLFLGEGEGGFLCF